MTPKDRTIEVKHRTYISKLGNIQKLFPILGGEGMGVIFDTQKLDIIYERSPKAYHCMTMKRNVSRKHTSLTMISFEVNMSRFRNR